MVVFKKAREEVAQKCRENKWVDFISNEPLLTCSGRFILRDFTYDADKISQQQNDLDVAGTSEKELWVSSHHLAVLYMLTSEMKQTELLRLSRTNFSEAFQLLVHIKVLRLFVESVLRYGLPANYVGLVIKVRFFAVQPIHIPMISSIARDQICQEDFGVAECILQVFGPQIEAE